jgi:hypothetical protein
MGEYDVLLRNEYGVQVISLEPTELELLVFGGASHEDCAAVDRFSERYGRDWLTAYARSKTGLSLGELAGGLPDTDVASSPLPALALPKEVHV